MNTLMPVINYYNLDATKIENLLNKLEVLDTTPIFSIPLDYNFYVFTLRYFIVANKEGMQSVWRDRLLLDICDYYGMRKELFDILNEI